MSVVQQFSKTLNKITTMFQPKLHVVGLGRWGSTISKEKSNISWFHDMCNYDNCYTSMFTIIRFKNPDLPKSPEPPKPHTPIAEFSIPKTNNTLHVLPFQYASDMPPRISNM